MDLHLANRCAVITGAAQGIGKAIAQAFLQEECRVVLIDINRQQLDATAEQLSQHYAPQVDSYQCDITDEQAIQSMFATIIQQHGVDILVNNAGITEPAPIEEMSYESWKRVLDVNTNAAFLTSKAVFGHMKQRHSGIIVNIGSFAGKRGTLFGNNISYAVSKAAIIGLTKALVPEATAAGIRTVAICPGIVQTDLVNAHSPEKQQELAALIPVGAFAQPQDIADAVVFLSSSRAQHFIGCAVDVNGGLYID